MVNFLASICLPSSTDLCNSNLNSRSWETEYDNTIYELTTLFHLTLHLFFLSFLFLILLPFLIFLPILPKSKYTATITPRISIYSKLVRVWFFFMFCFWATSANTQTLLLALYLELLSMLLSELYKMLWIKLRLTPYKISVLPTVIFLWPLCEHFVLFYFFAFGPHMAIHLY